MTTIPKWLEKPRKDNEKHERRHAKRVGGRAQPSSGRFWFAKGDTKDKVFLTDNKQTERSSYTITRVAWEQLTKWAQREGRLPHLQIEMIGKDGKVLELSVIETSLVEQIIEDHSRDTA